ncbi:MAG: hypothetical protein WCX71_00315 [Candidatus Buchananbacteria bacterium]
MNKKPVEIRGIYHCEVIKTTKEVQVKSEEPRHNRFYGECEYKDVTVSEKEFVRTVQVTETGNPYSGKILPIASHYGQLKDGDEVVFIISDDNPPKAAMVHPKNYQPSNSRRPGLRQNPWYSSRR